jgi:hypothetical protein
VLCEEETWGVDVEKIPGGMSANDEEHDLSLVASMTSPAHGLTTTMVRGGCRHGGPVASGEKDTCTT